MTDWARLKSALLKLVDKAPPGELLSPEDVQELDGLASELSAHSLYVPAERLDVAAGNWETLFASFGPKHSAGKALVQDSDLAVQAFNHLPSAAIRVSGIRQEIDPPTAVYSNVILFSAPDGSADGVLVIHGRYMLDATRADRFHVAFDRAELRAGSAGDMAGLLRALGLAPDALTDASFKPPKLHSDMVYLDDDLRINRGNFGGLYVVARCPSPMISLPPHKT